MSEIQTLRDCVLPWTGLALSVLFIAAITLLS